VPNAGTAVDDICLCEVVENPVNVGVINHPIENGEAISFDLR